jgi:hypothetical protein
MRSPPDHPWFSAVIPEEAFDPDELLTMGIPTGLERFLDPVGEQHISSGNLRHFALKSELPVLNYRKVFRVAELVHVPPGCLVEIDDLQRAAANQPSRKLNAVEGPCA